MQGKDVSPAERPGRALVLKTSGDAWMLACHVWVADKPGELEEICSFMGRHQANIELFIFNRSHSAHKVRMAMACPDARTAGAIAQGLRDMDRLYPPRDPARPGSGEEAEVTDPEALLTMIVSLEDRPGTMGRLAGIFKSQGANVIHMRYDGANSPGSVEVSMATDSPKRIAALLEEMNRTGYAYHLVWRGGVDADLDGVVGLSEAERFILGMKSLMADKGVGEVETLIRSSAELQQTLADFRREAGGTGEAMALSEVFSNILQLAAASRTRTGDDFSLRLTGPLRLTGRVSLYMLACPTGANAYLLKTGDGLVLIDSSYGLYYKDVKRWLTAHGLDPAGIKTALFTHSDADHVGWAGPLQREYGTRVFMHPDCREVFNHCNRAQGSGTRLLALNGHYTRLINTLTELTPPESFDPFPAHPTGGRMGGFPVIGRVVVEDLELTVLESLGGHVPGQVFFLAEKQGLLFSGDYLIDVPSLSERSKSTLSIARFLVTSTNSDSRVFGREMGMLEAVMLGVKAKLGPTGAKPRIFPGHGDYYAMD